MATNTYVELNKVTVAGTSTTSVTLSGISGLYTDLRLVINSQNQNSTNQPYIQFNADTSTGSTNYSTTSMRGDGSSAASSRHTNQNGWYPVPGPGVGTTGNFQPWLVDIMNYSNTTTFKTGLTRFNNSASIVAANVHLWRSTAAITSITITAESGAGYLVPGSTFSLYGISSAGDATPKATGGDVYSNDTYWYHVFTMSGNFIPNQTLSCDYLVVAGGGGGGAGAGGGGGAGAFRTATSQSLAASTYQVLVGAGGATNTGTNVQGNDGSNSVFNALTATGGGGGGAYAGQVGRNGGSGGGGGGAGNASGGSGTTGGNNGGSSINVANIAAAGGGGAGAAGTSNTSAGQDSVGGSGGVGLSTAISGGATTGAGELVSSTYYFAGGGGGAVYTNGTRGAAGYGGGGIGAKVGVSVGTAGTVNTGGGGGGDENGYGRAGGSGIVIIRYAK